jgi:DNA-binding LacI/PurR family transcriptional regulator
MFFSMKFPESYVEKFRQIGLPVVLVDTSHKLFDSITVRNVEGATIAVNHLYDLGHRQIAMINGFMETQPARERFQGYKKSLESHGLSVDDDLVFSPGREPLDGFSRETGRNLMKDVIRQRRSSMPITAVFVASDIQAIGVLEAAREEGIRIPEDIAVVSFDDIELATQAGLTTMRQPMYEMGSRAVEWLMSGMEKKTTEPRTTSFLPELIIRHSCGASLHGDSVSSIHHGETV